MTVGIIYGVSAFISGLNAVLRMVLREFSRVESFHTITERLASATTKMWVVQFINTALVLFLINWNYQGLF